MIRRVFSIASLTMRAAIRSRLMLSVAVVLLIVMVAVPLTVQGDGTLAGSLQVLLHFTLGLVGFILGVTTLWAACAGISRDIEDRRIRLVAVKPVRKGEIWMGKWLGLMVLNAVLLLVSGVMTCACMSWELRRFPGDAEQRQAAYSHVLVGQRRTLPRAEDVSSAVQARLDTVLSRLMREGKTVSSYERGRIEAYIRRLLRSEGAVLSAGQSKTWSFEVPQKMKAGAALIRVNVSPVSGVAYSQGGTWRIALDEREHLADGAELVQSAGRIAIPFELSGGVMHVTYTHPPGERTMIFDAERPLELLVAEQSFLFNLSRALLMVLCRLAVLAALGLAAGTLFSFPVATFLSASIVFLSFTGHYFMVSEKGDDQSPIAAVQREDSFLYQVGEELIVRLEIVAGPSLRTNPFADLGDGILITGRALGEAGSLMIVHVTIFGLISSFLLRRRELAA